MTDYTNLILTFEGPVALLTMNRPKALNALDANTLMELGAAIEEVRTSDARVLFSCSPAISSMSNICMYPVSKWSF